MQVAAPVHAQITAPAANAPTQTVDAAVAHAIRSAADGPLREFYAERGFRPLWIARGQVSAAAHTLLGHIAGSAADGLNPDDYDPDVLRDLMTAPYGGSPDELARIELKLSHAFARLVSDMRRPRTDMHYAEPELTPGAIPPADVLRHAARAESFADYLTGMEWMHPFYTGLRAQLLTAQQQHQVPSITVPAGPLLRHGDSGERVALLRQRLGLAGDGHYDDELAQAVRSFQHVNGLAADGVAGSRTLAALNRGLDAAPRNAERILAMNLERARLLPDAHTRHVIVNAAAAELSYYGQGKRQGAMKVVVGTPDTPTPMMAGMIRYATLNPYWNLPADLAARIIAPRMIEGHSLAAMGYEVLSGWTREAEVIDPATVDWRSVAAGKELARVRQLPSARNSMGSVKYIFPNEMGVFLHDTPSRSLFDKPARQFSNGCVRLEDADRLGEWLFGQRLTSDTKEPEQYRHVPEPVPVYITYLTAAPVGRSIAFFPDVYARDTATGTQVAVK
ncbi:L,D-transpeptidase family protein [Erythrobacter sp. NFXS35]